MSLIVLVVDLAVLAWFIPVKLVRGFLAFLAMTLWFACFFAFAGLLTFESIDSATCPIEDSVYASSHWSWVPPGAVCEYPAGDAGPTYWRIPALLMLAAIPPLAVVAWPRRHQAIPISD
jgi:hypothetical protein